MKYFVNVKNEFGNVDYIRNEIRMFRDAIYSNPELTMESSTTNANTHEFTFSFEDIYGLYYNNFPDDGLMMTIARWSRDFVIRSHSRVRLTHGKLKLADDLWCDGEDTPHLNMLLEIESEEEKRRHKRAGVVWHGGPLFPGGLIEVTDDEVPFFAESYEANNERFVKVGLKVTGEWLYTRPERSPIILCNVRPGTGLVPLNPPSYA